MRSPGEALAAARVIYRGLGIDFRGLPRRADRHPALLLRSVYTPRVCALVSALDRGLLAGLSGGGELRFRQRLTEGACCCRAAFEANVRTTARPAPRAIVVGSGAGGAAAARELQGTYQVTVLEAGREFRPLGLSVRWMERLRNWGLLFDERLIRLVFPAMRVRKCAGGLVHVNGVGHRRHDHPERGQRPAPGRAAARSSASTWTGSSRSWPGRCR